MIWEIISLILAGALALSLWANLNLAKQLADADYELIRRNLDIGFAKKRYEHLQSNLDEATRAVNFLIQQREAKS